RPGADELDGAARNALRAAERRRLVVAVPVSPEPRRRPLDAGRHRRSAPPQLALGAAARADRLVGPGQAGRAAWPLEHRPVARPLRLAALRRRRDPAGGL